MTGLVLDEFAGAGGWSEALRILSRALHAREVGVEWDKAACLTRRAAGHRTVRADVAQLVLEPMVGKVTGYIGSPPCQAWSKAGKGLGLLDQPRIFAHLAAVEKAGGWIDYPREGWHDPRSPLVLEVVRAVLTIQPRWVACEQVPDVLPFWRAVARLLRQHGYSAAAFVLSAEEYGVAQTRQRAFIVASLDRVVQPPAPTHTAYDARLGVASRWSDQGSLFGEELLPWVSMADALDWTPGSVDYRRTRGAGINARHGMRPDTSDAAPAPTLTEKSRSDEWVYRNGNQANAAERPVDCPAPTVHFAAASADVRWVMCAAGRTSVESAGTVPRPTDVPSATLTGKGTAAWAHRTDVSRQDAEGSVRVTVQQAAIIQGFRPNYPWQGSRTAQHRQVGDAVPPLLGLHVLAAATGLPLPSVIREAA